MSFGDFATGLGSSIWNTVVGTPINNALSISAAQRNQRYAREQMAFQEDMSNTAHQREVEDLKKAGLNPLYSAMGMSGASTPVGQSGSISQASFEPSDIASAKDLLKYFDSQKDNVEAGTQKTKAETNQTNTLTPVLKTQAETASAKNLAEKAEAEERATTTKIQNDYWKTHPNQYAVNQWINTIGGAVNTVSSAMSLMNNFRMTNSNIEKNHVDSLNKSDLVRHRNR